MLAVVRGDPVVLARMAVMTSIVSVLPGSDGAAASARALRGRPERTTTVTAHRFCLLVDRRGLGLDLDPRQQHLFAGDHVHLPVVAVAAHQAIHLRAGLGATAAALHSHRHALDGESRVLGQGSGGGDR